MAEVTENIGKNNLRSARTKERIMRAALACIYDSGLQNTSTVDIAKRAKVSRGAMLHHYPSRQMLLIAAYAAHLDREVELLRARAEEYSSGQVTLEGFIDYLWSRFSQESFAITADFIVAARTDNDLKHQLARARNDYDTALQDIWRQFFLGSAQDEEQAMSVFALTISLFRGLGLQKIMQTGPFQANELVEDWKSRLTVLLGPNRRDPD